MTRFTFPKVSIKGVRRWRDASGKRRQTTREFFQTLNPFNVTGDHRKTREEILVELRAERDAWLSEIEKEANRA